MESSSDKKNTVTPLRRFLGWDKPLVKLAAAKAAELASGSFPAEFAGVEIVLPTAEAARMLKAELLHLFADNGGFAGLVVGTTEMLWGGSRGIRAGQGQVLAAWVRVLQRYFRENSHDSSRLFPGFNREFAADTGMLLKIAAGLQETRMVLAREGWRIPEVVERIASLPGEIWAIQSERFGEFDRLCSAYLAELAEIAPGASDPAENLLEAIADAGKNETPVKTVFIDLPAMSGGVRKFLAGCRREVEIWINAPEEYAANFDGYGVPDPDFWSRIPMPCDIDSTVRVYKDSAAISRKLAGWLTEGRWCPDFIGVLSNEVADILCREHEAGGLGNDFAGFFRPGDHPLAVMPWSRLLLALLALRNRNVPFLTAAELLRHPYLPDYLEKCAGISAYGKLLTECDELQSDTLAGDFEPAVVRATGELREVFELFLRWRKRLSDGAAVVKEAFALLGEIGSVIEESRLDMERAAAELNALKKCGAQAAEIADPEVASALLVTLIHDQKISFRNVAQDAVGLVGFAELSWRPEREMVIAGFNEESFDPDPGADVFLPETLRRELGISCGDLRYAADALRFRALCASRDMRILVGRYAADRQGLKVPRLLLQCRREELPERVDSLLGDRLFEELPASESGKFPGFLPREVEVPEKFSVTGFASYLGSPFDFYLERLLNARSMNDRNCELDNLQFGTLIHQVLEEYGRDGRGLRRAEEIRKFCQERLERIVSRTFALPVSGLVRLQLDLVNDSLGAFARAQEEHLAAGWQIKEVEYKFSVPWDRLSGMPGEGWRSGINIVGKVDRIDVLELPDGRRRVMVMDYKTYAAPKKPAEVHCRIPVKQDDKVKWFDLQLPLYRNLVLDGLGGKLGISSVDEISAGYFNLPLVLSATGIYPFNELDEMPYLNTLALEEADRVLKNIYCDRIFWPPAGTACLTGDDFVPDINTVIPPEERQNRWKEPGGGR